MELYEAKVPKNKHLYEITRDVYLNDTRNVLLWVFHCLYMPTNEPQSNHLAALAYRGIGFIGEEKNLLKSIILNGVQIISTFDILLLSKVIKNTCLNRKSEKSEELNSLMHIKKSINHIIKVRHKFAHDDITVCNYEVDDFIQLIRKLLNCVKLLIIGSGSLSGKPQEESKQKLIDILFDMTSKISNSYPVPLQNIETNSENNSSNYFDDDDYEEYEDFDNSDEDDEYDLYESYNTDENIDNLHSDDAYDYEISNTTESFNENTDINHDDFENDIYDDYDSNNYKDNDDILDDNNADAYEFTEEINYPNDIVSKNDSSDDDIICYDVIKKESTTVVNVESYSTVVDDCNASKDYDVDDDIFNDDDDNDDEYDVYDEHDDDNNDKDDNNDNDEDNDEDNDDDNGYDYDNYYYDDNNNDDAPADDDNDNDPENYDNDEYKNYSSYDEDDRNASDDKNDKNDDDE